MSSLAEPAENPKPLPARPLLLLELGLLVALALAALLAGGAAAETPINNSSTSSLFVLDIGQSPYLLDHDFHVYSGGFFLVPDGVELRMDNGSKLVGDGGSISVTGSTGAPAVVGPRPASNFTTWGGFELQNGSVLTLHHARVSSADRAVTMLGIATLDAQDVELLACGAWCVNTAMSSTLSLHDSLLDGGAWGLVEHGALNPVADNVTIRNFTSGGVWFTADSAGASFSRIRVGGSAAGIVTDGLRSSALGPLAITATGAAVSGAGAVDVLVHNATLASSASAAVDEQNSLRLTLRDSTLTGATAALVLDKAAVASLQNNSLEAPTGVCLSLNNVTNALLRGNSLTGCPRTIAFGSSSAPPTADADRSNTVGGRPLLWITNAAGVEVGALDEPGFLLLSSVTGANLTDLRLRGAGIYIFGSSDIRVERVLVEGADAGLTAVGTRGLNVSEFVARSVSTGLVVRGSTFFPPPQDILVNATRIEGASRDGLVFADITNLTVAWSYARAGAAAVNVSRVQGALLRHLVVENSTVGLDLYDSTGVTVVDSVLQGNTAFGLRASNSTGTAARNAFVDNPGAHATSPSSPSFLFTESGGGNFWSGFTAPNANGDAFYDAPYNFTDGTGQDTRPRILRLDFAPTVVVLPPGLLEVGLTATLDASLSFDDFQVSTIYWSVAVPGGSNQSSGPLLAWRALGTGNFTVTVGAVDSAGGSSEYRFNITVLDRTAPTIGAILVSRPELGGNATVTLANTTDNDPAFPALATVSWRLTRPSGVTGTGAVTGNLSFDVPIDLIGAYALTVTVTDAWGNSASASAAFQAFDTEPPAVEFIIEGLPDLAEPFALDASQARDPTGVDSASARWSWIDGGQVHNSSEWPSVDLLLQDVGDHTVALFLCDRAGNCGNTSLILDIQDRSGPRLTVLRVIVPGKAPVEVRPGEAVVVDANANDEVVFEVVARDASLPVNFTWDFGQGPAATGPRVAHRFEGIGEVTVSCAMTDAVGNTNTTAVRVRTASGGIFGNLIPGGDLGAALLLLGIGGMVAVTVLAYRWRSKYRKNY